MNVKYFSYIVIRESIWRVEGDNIKYRNIKFSKDWLPSYLYDICSLTKDPKIEEISEAELAFLI